VLSAASSAAAKQPSCHESHLIFAEGLFKVLKDSFSEVFGFSSMRTTYLEL